MLNKLTASADTACAGLVMREPLLLVIGGAALGFLLITLLSLIWYLKRRVSASSRQQGS